jgi:antirestriction protein ArdC
MSALWVLCRYRHKTHWSGAEKRLNRNLTTRFGTDAYMAEEIVAELISAFLCAELGIQGELRHAGYIDHWLTLLRSDPKAIFTASSKASQAAHYLRSFSQMDGVKEEDNQ